LNITDAQIREMKDNIDNIDFDNMEKWEKRLRHDLMAGVHCFADVCPKASPIIHLGATSCDITDNSELIQIHKALLLIRKRLISLIAILSKFSDKYKSLVCLGYTHFQPAQPTTIGKRAASWLYELLMHFLKLEDILSEFKLKGIKGATGTQDSYLKLFNGEMEKVKKLDKLFCEKLGFNNKFEVVGQTYPRIFDCRVMNFLSELSASTHKFATDFRLMQHLKMVDEPFEKEQIGSSAMAYKKNPMRSERICSLSRFVMAQSVASNNTAAVQWFERTLDDSAGRRLYISQGFMAVDAILNIYSNIISKGIVYEKVIEKLLYTELPFMATETILMDSVKKGENRQEVHESIRKCSVRAAEEIKNGKENRLFELLEECPNIHLSKDEMIEIMSKFDFSGLAKIQVDEFLNNEVKPLLNKYKHLILKSDKIRV
jgi:adenylosuccinate lyase